MPRFSIKNLLLATTLIALGMGLIYYASQHPNLKGDETWHLLGGWFGGGALIGAGAMTPFKKPWAGVIVVVAIQLLLMLAMP